MYTTKGYLTIRVSVYIFWFILSVVQWKQGSGMGFQADLLRVLSLDCCSKSKQTPSCAGSLMRTPSSKVTPVCLLCVVLLTRTHGSPSSSTRNTNLLLLGLSALDGQIQEDRAFWLWCLRCLEDHLLQDDLGWHFSVHIASPSISLSVCPWAKSRQKESLGLSDVCDADFYGDNVYHWNGCS